eukprot:309062_1
MKGIFIVDDNNDNYQRVRELNFTQFNMFLKNQNYDINPQTFEKHYYLVRKGDVVEAMHKSCAIFLFDESVVNNTEDIYSTFYDEIAEQKESFVVEQMKMIEEDQEICNGIICGTAGCKFSLLKRKKRGRYKENKDIFMHYVIKLRLAAISCLDCEEQYPTAKHFCLHVVGTKKNKLNKHHKNIS